MPQDTEEIDGEIVAGGDEDEASSDLVLVSKDKLAEVISGMTEIDTAQSVIATRYRIVAEMLAAETEEELYAQLPTWSTKHNVGKVFQIDELRGVFKSRYPDAETGVAGGFLACSAVAIEGANAAPDQETGEIGDPSPAGTTGILSTSALRIAGKLGWYHMHGKMPVTVRIVKRGESAEGYPILDVERV